MSEGQFPESTAPATAEIEMEMESLRQKAISENRLGKVINKTTGELISSNLTQQQWLIVRTKAFKEWFGSWEDSPEAASKIVDENGEPLVVYHGTKGSLFDSFDTENISELKKDSTEGRYKNIGAYFTPSYTTALGLTKKSPNDPRPLSETEDPERVIAVFLNIRHPKVVGKFDLGFRNLTHTTRAVYQQQGFDGIFFKGRRESPEYIAFFANQIKSATRIHSFDQTARIY